MRRKKKPVPILPSPIIRSRKRARQVTTQFHRLNAEECRLMEEQPSNGRDSKLATIRLQLESLGGRQAYQKASQLNTSLCRNTSRFVISRLLQHGVRPRKEKKLEVLEVGAINTQLLDMDWMNVQAIDLQAQHPRIEQIDFFDVPPSGCKDVVVSSMVLNSVPTPRLRGSMLMGYRQHLKLGGHLFIMIPAMCLTHSPDIDEPKFCELLNRIGFSIVEIKRSPKVFYFYSRAVGPAESPAPLQPAAAAAAASASPKMQVGEYSPSTAPGSRKKKWSKYSFSISFP